MSEPSDYPSLLPFCEVGRPPGKKTYLHIPSRIQRYHKRHHASDTQSASLGIGRVDPGRPQPAVDAKCELDHKPSMTSNDGQHAAL